MFSKQPLGDKGQTQVREERSGSVANREGYLAESSQNVRQAAKPKQVVKTDRQRDETSQNFNKRFPRG